MSILKRSRLHQIFYKLVKSYQDNSKNNYINFKQIDVDIFYFVIFSKC